MQNNDETIRRVWMVVMLAYMGYAGELTGFVALDNRLFFHDPLFSEQRHNSGPSLVAEPEWYHVSDDEAHIITAQVFLRYDKDDSRRSHVDVRQLDWLWAGEEWELRMGVGKVFWGVTEANHLVDIINQTDAIEDVDGEDKLGQPMVQLAMIKPWGTLRFFYLPYVRKRSFAGTDGRLRAAQAVDTSQTDYESSMRAWRPSFAGRYEHSMGDWDIGFAHYSGTSQEPTLSLTNNRLIAAYQIIDQTSMDIQFTRDAWLWKLEAMTRSGHDRRFAAYGIGVEYTFFNAFDTDMDIGLLAEYHYDNRSSNAPATLFDHDIFVGSRITLNDVQDTQFLAGMVADTHNGEQFYTVETSRRIGDQWKLELEGRIYTHIDPHDPASFIRKDDHMQLRLAWYF